MEAPDAYLKVLGMIVHVADGIGVAILVAGDLIRTVAVAPTLDNVFTLGIIVLIRTFLSFSLEIEIEGTLPWRRALTQNGASVIADAVRRSDPSRESKGG